MKTIIKNNVLEYCEVTTNIEEAIYIIDNIYINGEFDYGIRGLDHNALLGEGYTWLDLLSHGTVIVPENSTYISDNIVEELEVIGYTRLPLNDNHIIKES